MSALTDPQLKILLAPVNPKRVGQTRGLAHMEAWDIRRQLIRLFGFGGYSTETLALDLVAERETKQGDRSRWTVVYRAQVRLTIYDTDGKQLGFWDDGAAGDSVNQPSLGDAHDMAMKTALSQALKRCATNLGDQFGLSLYNDGSPEPVVHWSAAHPPKPVTDEPAQPMPALDADPPVKPEPQAEPQRDETPQPAPVAEERPRPRAVPQPAPDPDEREAALAAMWDAAKQANFTDGLPAQFASAFGHPIEDGTADEFMQARQLIVGSAAA
ncbi:Rad52/Rad22 family DNA repair protein [Streptomyces sp. NBC_01264]|uniref:Rad52/Rad22 family DNA repair protein n=1 Tax=Streptomyces sp. NBC_01264 TaxID=2903804 RepID=UPI002257E318|nr:Rad52/Rad22 family DNA repair protein [Streptomyces sp. NBC_01264]MCX4778116.1 Rad52/Rad22 family DNA repair protein [Streptomyces sp. NBC_01264]